MTQGEQNRLAGLETVVTAMLLRLASLDIPDEEYARYFRVAEAFVGRERMAVLIETACSAMGAPWMAQELASA